MATMSRVKPAAYQSTQLRRRCLPMNDRTAATLISAFVGDGHRLGGHQTGPVMPSSAGMLSSVSSVIRPSPRGTMRAPAVMAKS